MESCETCKKYKVCMWKGEAAELLKTHVNIKLNPDSPFSILLYCREFEKNEGIRN